MLYTTTNTEKMLNKYVYTTTPTNDQSLAVT